MTFIPVFSLVYRFFELWKLLNFKVNLLKWTMNMCMPHTFALLLKREVCCWSTGFIFVTLIMTTVYSDFISSCIHFKLVVHVHEGIKFYCSWLDIYRNCFMFHSQMVEKTRHIYRQCLIICQVVSDEWWCFNLRYSRGCVGYQKKSTKYWVLWKVGFPISLIICYQRL